MSHPAEYFIKFTIAYWWGEDGDYSSHLNMEATLKAFDLPSVTEKEYDRIFNAFKPPDTFKPNNKTHPGTQKFMRDEKIFTMWCPGREDKRVISELTDGNKLVKHTLHLLLMGRIPYDVIAEKLNSKYRMNPKFTERMIATYAHYFWNVANCSHKDWESILEDHPGSDALMAALYCGDQQALYRAGFNPRVEGEKAMKEAYRQAYFRMEALRYAPDTKNSIDCFNKLSARLLNVHEVLYSQGTGLQDQLRQFRQLMMAHKDPDVIAVDKLISKVAGGSYSGDGEKQLAPKKDGEPDDGDQLQ